METLQKSTYSQSQNIDADPVKHLETSTTEYLHMSFLLWEYKQAYSKKEYRELLDSYCWDKGKTEERKALKLAENFQDFAHRPHFLFQIPVTTLLKLCSDKYRPIIEQLSKVEEDLTCDYVEGLIKDRATQLKNEKQLQLPEKPSIWRRNCRQERYAAFPPLYEEDEQTGILTQQLMDEYGLLPQEIMREAIKDLHQKKQQEENAAQDVDVRENSYSDNYSEPAEPVNQSQTVEEKWQQLNQQLQTDIKNNEEISQSIGQLVFEACQQWEAAVPVNKRWSAITNIVGRDETSLKYLSNYAYGNHSEWRHSWGATFASYDNFEQELQWVGINVRTDALIAMGYKIPAIVKVNDGSFGDKQGRIIELHGENDKPILVKFQEFQGYFHWSELEIVTEAETFAHCTAVEEIEHEYLAEPVESDTNAQETQEEINLKESEESDTEYEPTPLDKAIEALIHGTWSDIRNIFNEYPGIKSDAWKALSATQRKRVIDITPETNKLLNEAKKNGVIQEYKELATGVYHIKMPGAILWEQRAFHEIEVRHYLRKWQESMAKNQA